MKDTFLMLMTSFSSAERAFWLLLFFLALFFVVLGSEMVLFQIINILFPDPNSYFLSEAQSFLRTGFSFVLISGPLCFFSARRLHHALLSGELPFESAIRRWLEFLALFLTAAIIMGDLITLLSYFLSGDLTIRFLLKALTLLLISVAVFSFFWWDLREENADQRKKKAPWFFSLFVLFSVGVLGSAVFFLESPFQARLKNLDIASEQNIENVKWAIQDFFVSHGTLPQDMEEIIKTPNISGRFQHKSTLEYRRISSEEYEICDIFERDNTADQSYRNWTHASGRVCFTLRPDEK